jgi:predicted DNA-binding protein (MmcQ/YjbR family)
VAGALPRRRAAYIGRSGWNTLETGGAVPDEEILEAVDTSYSLVVSRLPKKRRPEGA